MDFNGVNSLMRQQLGALRNLDELLYVADTQGIPDGISTEDMDLFKDHVLRLKKVCQTASALSKHYQEIEKGTKKVAPVSVDDEEDDDGEEVHPLEGTLKAAFDDAVKEPPKEKKTRVRKQKVEPDPVEEDDLDDLLS